METSAAGRWMIELEEGKRKRRYLDSAGKGTIGIGHLIKEGETFPEILTEEEIQRIFSADLREMESAINEEVLHPLPQEKFDALACLVFNIGKTQFRQSTVLRMLNLHRWQDAADAFLFWDKERDPNDRQKLRRNEGLAARRARERLLFLKGEYRND